MFLSLVVIDAALLVAVPAGAAEDHRRRASCRGTGPWSSSLALVVAGLAVLDGVLSLVQRWFSARIGEGLIYDLRTQVFAHVQRMPVAFFTRTQTGALVSRLNNDVLGAQQAFTNTLSRSCRNIVDAWSWSSPRCSTCPGRSRCCVGAAADLHPPGQDGSGGTCRSSPASRWSSTRDMSTTMTERFNVAGALLVKLFGRPPEETAQFAATGRRGSATSASPRRCTSRFFFAALTLVASLATALVYGVGGDLRDRRRRSTRRRRCVALAALLTRLYGPLTALSNVQVDVMTALVSFDRVFEVLDLQPDDRREARRACRCPPAPPSVEFDAVDFRYPGADEVSLASLESVARARRAPQRPGAARRLLPGRARAAGRAGRPLRRRQDDDHQPGRPALRRARAAPCGSAASTSATLTLESLRDTIGVVTQDAHMFHDTIRANLLYARPDATEDELLGALHAPRRSASWSRRCPTAWTPWSATAATACPAGRSSAWRIARLLLKAPVGRRARRGDRAPGLASPRPRCSGRWTTALAGRTSLVIAHRLSTVREADQILVRRRRPHRGAGPARASCWPPAGSTRELYRTQFAD